MCLCVCVCIARRVHCSLHAISRAQRRRAKMGGCAHCCCAISINRVLASRVLLAGYSSSLSSSCSCSSGFSLFIAKVVFVYLSTCNGGCTNNSPPGRVTMGHIDDGLHRTHCCMHGTSGTVTGGGFNWIPQTTAVPGMACAWEMLMLQLLLQQEKLCEKPRLNLIPYKN